MTHCTNSTHGAEGNEKVDGGADNGHLELVDSPQSLDKPSTIFRGKGLSRGLQEVIGDKDNEGRSAVVPGRDP